MGDCCCNLCATLIVLALLAIFAIAVAGRCPARASREGYLVYPYLDLDEPGTRGSYYGLSEGC